ncbi:MAG: hypothetical protein AB4058_04825 [Microcystaceae cyanobacterium]
MTDSSSVLAQFGNQSDATNPGIANFQTVIPLPRPVATYPTLEVQLSVNQAASVLVSSLSENSLRTVRNAPLAASSQSEILSVLTGDANSSLNSELLIEALTGASPFSQKELTKDVAPTSIQAVAEDAPPLSKVENLVSSLENLIECQEGCTKVNVEAEKLLTAIRAYNDLIQASGLSYLEDPPPVLLGIQSSLAQLLPNDN